MTAPRRFSRAALRDLPPLLLAMSRSCFSPEASIDTIAADTAAAFKEAVRLTQPGELRDADTEMSLIDRIDLWTSTRAYQAARAGILTAVKTSKLPRTSDEDAATELATDIEWLVARHAFLFGLAVAYQLLRGKGGAR